MSFDYENKKSSGAKSWAKEREQPAGAETAEGRCVRLGSAQQQVQRQECGSGPGGRPAAAGFSGPVSALLTERPAFTCLPHVAQATDHFLPQISSPKEGLTVCIPQRNY